MLAALGGAFLGLAWVSVLLRVYVRTCLIKQWDPTDSLLLGSLAAFTAQSAVSIAAVNLGFGRRTIDIPDPAQHIPKILMYYWICEILYPIVTVLVRLSIAVLLLRFCQRNVHKIIIYTTSTIMLAYSISYLFLCLFQCAPVSYFWEQALPDTKGKCLNSSVVPTASYVHSAISFTADWTLGLLPIWLVWDLQMDLRVKITVGAILSLGLIAGIAALIRIPYIHDISTNPDLLYALGKVGTWSYVEVSLGIIATSVTALRPLFKQFYKGSRSTSNRQGYGYMGPSPWGTQRAGYSRSKVSSQPFKKRPKNSVYNNGIEMASGAGNVSRDVRGPLPRLSTNEETIGVELWQEGFSATSEEEWVRNGEKGGIQVKKTIDVTSSNAR